MLRGRYLCQREFALKHMKDDPLFKLVSLFFEVVPPVLKAGGKVSAHSAPPCACWDGISIRVAHTAPCDYLSVFKL